MSFVHVLFGYQGRINRAKWWLAAVFWTVIWTVAIIALAITLAQDIVSLGSEISSEDAVRLLFSYGAIAVVFLLVVVIPMLVSGIFIGIKRLHDRNKSGWWVVLFYFAPMILQALGQNISAAGLGFILSVVSAVIAIWGLVELGFLRGTPGPNQYGPDPLSQSANATGPAGVIVQ